MAALTNGSSKQDSEGMQWKYTNIELDVSLTVDEDDDEASHRTQQSHYLATTVNLQ